MFQVFGNLAHLHVNLVADRCHRFHIARRLAIRAGRADGALKRLLHSLAGNGDQAEVVKLQDFRRSAVMTQLFFQSLHHALAVAALIHVNEVDDDDPAQITQANLTHDFLDGVHVGLYDRVFQARGLTYVFAGVDVDGHQRLSLVDYDVSTALQPHFRLEGLVHLFCKPELLKQRRLLRVELHAFHQPRLKAVEETQNALVLGLGVNPNHGEI